MIDFETPSVIERNVMMMKMVAESMVRPVSRQYDENEHEKPWDYINMVWETQKVMNKKNLDRQLGRGEPKEEKPKEEKDKRPPIGYMMLAHVVEMMSWGDAGIYLCTPDAGLGGTAIESVGTLEQKERFLTRFTEGEPKWGAMAITEPGAGSDTAAIQCTATLDRETNEWILNGEKIFVTSGLMARVRGGVGNGGSLGRAGRHQEFRRRAGHTWHERHQGRGETGHPRQRHGLNRF